MTDDFNFAHVQNPASLVSVEGFLSNQDGWYLDPGAEGRLVYRIAKGAGSHAAAAFWLYMAPPSIDGELRIVTTDSSRVIEGPYYNGAVVELGGDGAAAIDLEFKATNRAPTPQLVIDQIVWGLASGTPPPAPAPLSYVSFGFLAALIGVPLVGRVRGRWLILAVVGALMAAAVATRIGALDVSSRSPLPLDPDATAYRIYADSFQWWPPWGNGIFSASFGEREPFFPLVIRMYFDLLGSSDFHLRVVSSTLSLLAIPLVLVAARRRLGWPVALTVAAIVVLNRPLVSESVRGLRTELELCAVLLLFVLLDRAAPIRLLTAVGVGLVGAALVLTRTFYLPMVIAAVGVSLLGRANWRAAMRPLVVALAIVVFAVGAHRVAMFERHGDAFYDTGRYARWLANVERFNFQREFAHPELFPTMDEYISSGPYTGPPLSYAQYLFVLHTAPEFVLGSAAGLIDLISSASGLYVPGAGPTLAGYPLLRNSLDILINAADWLLRIFAVLGVLGLMISAWRRRRPRDLVIPSIIILGLSFSMFLYHLQLIERYRNVIQFYPLEVVAAGWFATELWRRRGRLGLSMVGQPIGAQATDLRGQELSSGFRSD